MTNRQETLVIQKGQSKGQTKEESNRGRRKTSVTDIRVRDKQITTKRQAEKETDRVIDTQLK